MNQEKIGKFISELRTDAGMTQKELAEKIGISDKTVSKWECGKSIPDLSYLDSLCEALNVNVNELISGEHLSASAYSSKAEENIMELMKQNEKVKKSSIIKTIIGVVLAVIAIFLTLTLSQYSSSYMVYYYLDYPTAILLLLLGTACVLISGKHTYRDILEILKKTAFPNGIFVTAVSYVMVLHGLAEDKYEYYTNISVICITLVYAAVEYLVVLLLLERAKNATSKGNAETADEKA